METGRLIVLLGGAIALVGAVVWALGRLGFQGMPGDISYRSESGGLRFYFPLGSSIVLSILLTLGFWIWNRLSNR